MLTLESEAQTSERQSPIVNAAQRLTGRIESLVDELAKLRADNQSLRREVREAVALLEAASSAAVANRAQRRPAANGHEVHRKRRTRGRAAKGRATPAEVTSDVVRAVLVKLGEATAAEIAAEINRARAQSATGSKADPVGGRAVRFLAERAGAVTTVGEAGQRRYRLG